MEESEKMYKKLKKQGKTFAIILLTSFIIIPISLFLESYYQTPFYINEAPAIIFFYAFFMLFYLMYFSSVRVIILNNYIKALENNELDLYYKWLDKKIQSENYKKHEIPKNNRNKIS